MGRYLLGKCTPLSSSCYNKHSSLTKHKSRRSLSCQVLCSALLCVAITRHWSIFFLLLLFYATIFGDISSFKANVLISISSSILSDFFRSVNYFKIDHSGIFFFIFVISVHDLIQIADDWIGTTGHIFKCQILNKMLTWTNFIRTTNLVVILSEIMATKSYLFIGCHFGCHYFSQFLTYFCHFVWTFFQILDMFLIPSIKMLSRKLVGVRKRQKQEKGCCMRQTKKLFWWRVVVGPDRPYR